MKKPSITISSIILQNTFTVFNIVIALITVGMIVLYWITSDVRLLLDAVGVVSVAIFNTILAILQEVRAYKTLEKAILATAPFAMVFREGAYIRIPAADLIPGNILKVERGDLIPADGIITHSDELEINEAILTGESESVQKTTNSTVHAGTFVVAGSATISVTHVGEHSVAGRIQELATRFGNEASALQKYITRVFEWSFVLALLLALVDALVTGVFTSTNVDDIRRVTTLLIGLIPEGLMFFTTITLTLGLVRMAQQGVIIQKITSLEILAGATIVCMDKTGTLTENNLKCSAILPLGNYSEAGCRELIAQYAHTSTDSGQVIEALRQLQPSAVQWNVQQRTAFSSSRKFSSLVVDDRTYILGAAETVFENLNANNLYTNVVQVLTASEHALKRVMVLVETLHSEILPIAWIVFEDAPRSDAAQTLEYLESRNVRWMILTGDAPQPVAVLLESLHQTVTEQQCILGSQINTLSQEALCEVLSNIRVAARLTPEHKLRIIQALKTTDVVAMVGDGVNDLPAIREANVGIAMNNSAGITKHVADVVLADTGFGVFPQMVTEGRIALRTVLNVAKLFVGKNVMLILMSALRLFFHLPFPLTPRKSALISVVAVGIPSILLAATASITTTSRNFLRELFLFVLISGASAVLCSHIVGMFITNPVLQGPCMWFAIIGSTMASFLCVDTMPRKLKLRSVLVCVSVGVAVFITSAVPYTGFPLNILRVFYELPILSLDNVAVAFLCGIVALLSTVGIYKVFRMVTLFK